MIENEQQEATGSVAAGEPETRTNNPRRRLGSGGIVAVLALIAALGAAGFSVHQWYRNRGEDKALRVELTQRLAETEARGKEAGLRATQSVTAAREAEAKLGALEARFGESQSQQINLQTLRQELAKSREEWDLADIEQSLLFASQQLQVAANVKVALIGLEHAEARLQRMDQPRYVALRRALTRDIERLRALPQPDIYGVSSRIDDIIAGVDKLPLAMDARIRANSAGGGISAPATDDPAWRRLLREVWQEIQQLVRVQRTVPRDPLLLAPEQAYFLRENLKLRLLGARIALLIGDGRVYQNDLTMASTMLERYFDKQDGTVTAAATAMRTLKSVQIQANVPDITATLEALRSLRQPRAKPQG